MTHAELLARLNALAEPDYAVFAAHLIPDCPPLLGVRLPTLRKLAKGLARQPGQALGILTADTFEERLLRGLVIAGADLPDPRRQALLAEYLPLADNWSLCDSTAATCRFMRTAPEVWLPWLHQLALSGEEFTARFGLVCLLDHFTDTPGGRRAVLAACRAAPCPALYTRLAAAWAVCEVSVKEPALGEAFLAEHRLDPFTQNKAIQKIRESFRADPAFKARLAGLRS